MSRLRSEEIIGDGLAGIEMVRPAIRELAQYDADAAKFVTSAMTLLYEGLVTIRAAEATATPEEIRAAIASQIAHVIQELAAAKFGAMPDRGGE